MLSQVLPSQSSLSAYIVVASLLLGIYISPLFAEDTSSNILGVFCDT